MPLNIKVSVHSGFGANAPDKSRTLAGISSRPCSEAWFRNKNDVFNLDLTTKIVYI
jgi:hypothetical protein